MTNRSRRSTNRDGRGPATKAIQLTRPFPESMVCELTYAETIVLDPGTTTSAINTFRANSIFDPNLSGTGHQPMYHDQLMALYNRYEVLSSRIEMIPLSISTNLFYGVDFSVQSSDLSGLTLDTLTELGRTDIVRSPSNVLVLGPVSDKSIARATYTPEKLGLRSGDDALGATFGTNPLSVGYFQGWVVGVYGADPLSCPFQFRITFRVKVSQTMDAASS